MAKFVKGDVVVVPFPFSDLTQAKKRPALVVSVLEGDDLILCHITIQTTKDKFGFWSYGQTSFIRRIKKEPKERSF